MEEIDINPRKNFVKKEKWRGRLKKTKFIANKHGHLKKRYRPKSSGLGKTAFRNPMRPGKYGYTFTPMGYNSYTTKSNVRLIGVRKELGNTNLSAHQYLHKKENPRRYHTTYKVFRTKHDTLHYHGQEKRF